MTTVSDVITQAAQRQPELKSYYELHLALLALQEQAQKDIAATLDVTKEEVAARAQQGLPAITFDQLPIAPQRFAQLACALAQVLQEFGVETADPSLPVAEEEWIIMAREQFGGGAVTSQETPVSLAQMAARLALRPYLRWAARYVLPYVNQELWRRGYCPVCGGRPDFAALDADTGARRLLCSRCDAQWLYRRIGCPFCETTDHTQIVYYPSEDGIYRLYVCQACGHYLKTIDLRRAEREVLLPAERIITVAMDAAAQQEGYLAG